MKMPFNQWVKAIVLAGPIVFFPFSRSYYIFYVGILAFALVQIRLPALWKSWPDLRSAFYAFALPILLTTLYWLLFKGGAHGKWMGTFALLGLATVLGLSTAGLCQDERIKKAAQGLIGIAVISWLVDGCFQLLMGANINCRFSDAECANPNTVSLYFSGQTKLSYYIGMMALLPLYWLLEKNRKLPAFLLLMAATAVVMAAGSRFGMLAFLLGAVATVVMSTLSMPRLMRWAVFLAAPAFVLLFAAVFYYTNHAFHDRVAVTAMALKGLDYDAVNSALTWRLDIWFPAVALAMDHWLLGIGPGELSGAIKPYLYPESIFVMQDIKIFHAHQVVLEIWVATGLIGLLTFFAYYFRVAVVYVRAAAAGINMGVAALLVFLLMWFPLSTPHGFYSSELILLTFYMLGLGFGWSRRPSSRQADPNVSPD